VEKELKAFEKELRTAGDWDLTRCKNDTKTPDEGEAGGQPSF
jgi:hypothetical protein